MFPDFATPKTYRLRPAGYAPAAKRILIRRLALLGVIVVPILVGMGAKGILVDRDSLRRALVPPAVALLLMSALFAWFARRQFIHGWKAWQSYELVVGSTGVRRLHLGLPPMDLSRDEVTRVLESPDEGLTLGTVEADRLVFVPTALKGYEEVKAHVRAWGPANAPVVQQGALGTVVRSVVLVATWITAGAARDLTLAFMACAVLLPIGLWSLVEELRNPRIDSQKKRGISVFYALLMAAPFVRIALRWMPLRF